MLLVIVPFLIHTLIPTLIPIIPTFLLFISISSAFAEKIYVVERERGSVAVIEDGKLIGRIENLGNMTHSTIKFKDNHAYVISRDGWFSKIDVKNDKLLKKVRVGESSIGFDFTADVVAVANYSPKNVVLLDEELNIKTKVDTGSRNVGIKGFESFFIFSLMDKDEIWVINTRGERIRVFGKTGNVPFDALLSNGRYVVGFFNEPAVGLLNIKYMSFKKIQFKSNGKEVIFKVPHFGLWGIKENLAYIPAVGERKIYLVDIESFEVKGEIELEGLPVFAVLSNDGRYIAINYSGDKEDFISLVDTQKNMIIKNMPCGKRITHLRFSKSKLYVSSYFENKVKALSIPELNIIWELFVPNPSGVFLVNGKNVE